MHVSFRRLGLFGLVAAAALALFPTLTNTAALVARLGLDQYTAQAIVDVLVNRGPEVVVAIFPWLAPFIGTMTWLLQFGASYVVAF